MKRVLVLGNGLSVGPLVGFFLDRGDRVTVACRRPERNGRLGVDLDRLAAVTPLDLDDPGLVDLVRAHDLVASFVPGGCQPKVAAACLEARRSLVVSCHAHYFEAWPGGSTALDAACRAAGVAIISELGVDCGVLGMLCAEQIDRVKADGWAIRALEFHTGVLPGQYVNPLDYAFFWAAKKAALSYVRPKAGKADWIDGGARVRVDRETVYRAPTLVDPAPHGALETHPNLDSGAWPYREVYGLGGIERFYHGTLRHIGWCSVMQALLDLGYGGDAPRPELAGKRFAEVTGALCGASAADARPAAADRLGRSVHDDVMLRLEWLGLFSDRPATTSGDGSTADMVTDLMMRRMGVFGPDSGVASRVVNLYALEATRGGAVRRLRSVFDARDAGRGHSVCSRLISETTAWAGLALMGGALEGLVGLHHCYGADVRRPVLAGMAERGFEAAVHDAVESGGRAR